jgi:gluconolactonase
VTVIVDSPELAELIDPAATMTEIGSGYQFSEGPAWDVRHQALVFSDIPGDARWRWTPETGMVRVAWPTLKGNGLAFDLDGSLLVCEQTTSTVSRIRRDGLHELIAFHHEGVTLNSPNDVVVRAGDGSIYFTDPDYGRWNDWIGCKREFVREAKGVYRIPPAGGDVELVSDPAEFEQPNGLCFSPDESLLYVNDSPRCHIKVFDVAADGSLGPARLFFEGLGTGAVGASTPDGMKCDEHGNIWASGPEGVWVIDPDGRHLGTIPTPEFPGNLCWGGEDLRTLFVCSSTTVFSVRTKVASAPLPSH